MKISSPCSIHTYFTYAQRQARLEAIQEANGRPVLGLRNYVPTRWMSLGESIERLLCIWNSLKDYMEISKKGENKVEKGKKKHFFFLLNDATFKLEMQYLNYIMEKKSINSI